MTLLASYELNLNRGLLFVGSSPELDDGLLAEIGRLDRSVISSATCLMVRTRSQSGPVRLRLWDENHPLEGGAVFDGSITLKTGRISVYDFDDLFLSRHRFSAPDQTHHVSVRVDEPGTAARVDIIFGGGSRHEMLTAVGGMELAPVALVGEEPLLAYQELDLILSSHDIPLHRLAAAIKVIFLDGAADSYLKRQLAEWLRLVRPSVQEDLCKRIADRVAEDVLTVALNDIDVKSLESAREILAVISAI